MAPSESDAATSTDESLRNWRQGDCVLGEHWFVFRIEIDAPLTPVAVAAAAQGVDLAEGAVRGFAVITQTCDLVRGAQERPYVEVCPLVEVSPEVLHQVERCYRPQYLHVPGVAEQRLVADLDRVMTVEKAVAAGWERIPGCRTDEEARRFSLGLARKRARAAFPDDFNEFAEELRKRISSKHEKESTEGRALRALREIRVIASPSWDAASVSLFFWFIRNEGEPDFDGKGWERQLDFWLKLMPPRGRYTSVDGAVLTLDDLTARDYVESDLLDLDHLSSRAPR